ncbi:hypothetical protein BTJ_4687 [Burkholderia thailandensis E444]|nr:hypothetical protein BTJ_4687 [Burkholderia thailandensis E444]AIP28239.1 hypothetical protein DR63_5413 [Burkholderia thailandensis E264]AJY02258.1 hypothetical protein BG87_5484 [Burkholderia thailandensis 2002721643]
MVTNGRHSPAGVTAGFPGTFFGGVGSDTPALLKGSAVAAERPHFRKG